MKQWVKKLLEQFEIPWETSSTPGAPQAPSEISEERATLLHILDVYNRHLIEVDTQPIRRVRESLDEFAKGLIKSHDLEATEKTLFRLRQFFSSHRIDEYTYVQKTFDDFKNIIWDFADQLGEDIQVEQAQELEVKASLNDLREAVESNSIDVLRSKSREFIDHYIEVQNKKEDRRTHRYQAVQKNLTSVKKQLMDANQSMRTDHLTGAYNRKSFDEQMKKFISLRNLNGNAATMIVMDIDFFKKINDTYGHDVGDFVLKECVGLFKKVFHRETDYLARIGGEEFAILLPDYKAEHAVHKAEEAMTRIRKQVFIHGEHQIKFTVSMGIAELAPTETTDQWLKRADTALYESKHTGRNKFTVSSAQLKSVG